MRDVLLVIHFVGLAMGLGTAFAHAFLGTITSTMSAPDATRFRLNSLVLSKMGNVGIILLIGSGLGLMRNYWQILPSSPLLILKLTLVIILAIIIAIINSLGKKAQKGNPEEQLKKMQSLGKITMVLGLAIVIVAVTFFH
jgi:uncharacterized membrane protein